MSRIAAIGDNCIDVYTNLLQGYPGGGPVNFAVQARRAGAETTYVGVIGDDAYGDWIEEALAAEGVETSHLQRVPGPTALAFVRLVNGERTFIGSDHGVREQLRVTRKIDDYLAGFDLIHTTLDGGVDEHVPQWHRSGRKVSYDFSHRAKPHQIALLAYVDVAFFSGQYLEGEHMSASLAGWREQSAGVIVLTRGGQGSVAYVGSREFRQPALPARVVDTLGAGDAFQAGFVTEYLKSGSVQEALAAGADLAARACEHFGGFGHGHPIEPTDPRLTSPYSHHG